MRGHNERSILIRCLWMEYTEHASFWNRWVNQLAQPILFVPLYFYFFKGHNILTICRCRWIWCLFRNGSKVLQDARSIHSFHLSGRDSGSWPKVDHFTNQSIVFKSFQFDFQSGEYKLDDGWDGIKKGYFSRNGMQTINNNLAANATSRRPTGTSLAEAEPANRNWCC